MQPVRRYRTSHGFTAVEMMVTLALIAVILGIGVPNLNDLLVRQAVQGVSQALAESLQLARQEAIQRRAAVTICRSADPEAEVPTCSGSGGSWAEGWFLYEDRDKLGEFSTASGDKVIRVFRPSGRTFMAHEAGAPPPQMTFFAIGAVAGVVGNERAITIALLSGSKQFERVVCVSMMGRVRVREGGQACS